MVRARLPRRPAARLYQVETFKAMRVDPVSKKSHVLVKWRGYPDSQSTWEPYQNLVEDGFTEELSPLVSGHSAPKDSYLFVVRLSNTKQAPSGLYKSLRTFVGSRGGAGNGAMHIPGNVHYILRIAPNDVAAFLNSGSGWRVYLQSAVNTHNCSS